MWGTCEPRKKNSMHCLATLSYNSLIYQSATNNMMVSSVDTHWNVGDLWAAQKNMKFLPPGNSVLYLCLTTLYISKQICLMVWHITKWGGEKSFIKYQRILRLMQPGFRQMNIFLQLFFAAHSPCAWGPPCCGRGPPWSEEGSQGSTGRRARGCWRRTTENKK